MPLGGNGSLEHALAQVPGAGLAQSRPEAGR
jgi:hypothetical protein